MRIFGIDSQTTCWPKQHRFGARGHGDFQEDGLVMGPVHEMTKSAGKLSKFGPADEVIRDLVGWRERDAGSVAELIVMLDVAFPQSKAVTWRCTSSRGLIKSDGAERTSYMTAPPSLTSLKSIVLYSVAAGGQMTPERGGKVIACIPAFNEERTIAKVLVRASHHVDGLVVIDDGSEDDTGAIAEKLGALAIRHSQNLGKGIALRDGFAWAKENNVDVLVTLDADGQHDPDEIPSLVGPILAGEADIVIGYRSERPPGMTRQRRVAQKTLDALTGVREGGALVDSQSGFRAYSRQAVMSLNLSEWGLGVETEILLNAKKTGLKIHQVPVHMRYGTKVLRRNPVVQFTDVFSTIVKVSVVRRPLRVVGIPGLVLLVVGVFGWLDVLATYNAVQEFALGHAIVYTVILLTGILMTIAALLLFAVSVAIQRAR